VKSRPAALLLVLAIAFQASALPLYRAGGLAPDFPFLALCYLGLFAPLGKLLVHAALCGTAIDLLSLDPLGTRLAGYLPALWLLNLARRSFVAESAILRAALTWLACLAAGLLAGGWLALREGRWLGTWFELRSASYTALIGVGVHAALDLYRARLGWARDRFFVT
jgi:rod shape-determining protein MreD